MASKACRRPRSALVWTEARCRNVNGEDIVRPLTSRNVDDQFLQDWTGLSTSRSCRTLDRPPSLNVADDRPLPRSRSAHPLTTRDVFETPDEPIVATKNTQRIASAIIAKRLNDLRDDPSALHELHRRIVATRKKRQRALFRDGVFREHVDENKRNLSQQNLLLKRQQVAKKMHEVRDRVRARRQLLAIQRQQLDALLTTNADRQLSVEQVHQMVALRLAWTRKRWLAIAGAVSSAHAFATIFHARRQIHLARLVATRAAVTIQVAYRKWVTRRALIQSERARCGFKRLICRYAARNRIRRRVKATVTLVTFLRSLRATRVPLVALRLANVTGCAVRIQRWWRQTVQPHRRALRKAWRRQWAVAEARLMPQLQRAWHRVQQQRCRRPPKVAATNAQPDDVVVAVAVPPQAAPVALPSGIGDRLLHLRRLMSAPSLLETRIGRPVSGRSPTGRLRRVMEMEEAARALQAQQAQRRRRQRDRDAGAVPFQSIPVEEADRIMHEHRRKRHRRRHLFDDDVLDSLVANAYVTWSREATSRRTVNTVLVN